MHSVYHFYLVNQPNFVFIIFKISCSCALYSLHLECNLYPHLVIEIIIYILFRRYILISMIPILTNTNNTIKFTSRYSLITSPSTAIPERLPSKNIWEILSLIFSILAFTSFFVLRISISARFFSLRAFASAYSIFFSASLSGSGSFSSNCFRITASRSLTALSTSRRCFPMISCKSITW